MIDLNSTYSNFSDRVNHIIDTAPYVKEEPRKYLGASVIGYPCERSVQYHAIMALYPGQLPEVEHDAKIRRIFQRGHMLEELAANELKRAGFIMITEQNGKQIGGEWFGGRVRGHSDGIIVAQRASLPVEYPLLWEHKARNESNFKQFNKEKVKLLYPQYYAQCLFYMEYLNLKQTLFTMTNVNTMELSHQLFNFEQKDFDRYYQRVERILTYTDRGEYVPKSEKETSITCKYCDFKKVCWS